MLDDFVAIDFETANMQPSSVCSVGIVVVKDGEQVLSYYNLIRPEPNFYSYWCQRVHGLSAADTDQADDFPTVWREVEQCIAEVFPFGPFIPFVAHNARFDERCLRAVFDVYQMDYPGYQFLDTLAASRQHFGQSLPNHRLQTVAAACGYNLHAHHHALADAEACAAIALSIM